MLLKIEKLHVISPTRITDTCNGALNHLYLIFQAIVDSGYFAIFPFLYAVEIQKNNYATLTLP
jgi:hypothetical protein